MSGDPLVSVVMTTNRRGPFLPAALASLQAQTYTEWELIVVDDGSPDPAAVEAAVAGIPDTSVIHQANAGISVARNVGVAQSRGRYLTFLDDDDLWDPRRLALQVAALQERPDAVASYGQIDFIDEHGTIFGTGNIRAGDLGDFLRHDTGVPVVTLMVVRRVLDRVGVFHPMFGMGEDLDLVYRLARTGPLVFVPEVLVHYRRHGRNMTDDMVESALWSRRALWLQGWWSTRVGEADVLADVRTGLRQSRRYWTDRMVHEALHDARLGHYSSAREYAAFVARHDLVTGVGALVRIVGGKLRPGPRPPGD